MPQTHPTEPRGEFLLEVRSEEIPARMLEPGVKELATRTFEELMARGIAPARGGDRLHAAPAGAGAHRPAAARARPRGGC